jgi:hypothetical protein
MAQARLVNGTVYFYNPETHVVSDYNPYMGDSIGLLRAFTAKGDELLDGQNRIGGAPVVQTLAGSDVAPSIDQVLADVNSLQNAGVVDVSELRQPMQSTDAQIPQPVIKPEGFSVDNPDILDPVVYTRQGADAAASVPRDIAALLSGA